MNIWLRIKNATRNKLSNSLIGRLLIPRKPLKTIAFVSATRLNEAQFWKKTALGRSLGVWKKDANVSVHIHFENQLGLPLVYNPFLQGKIEADIVVFLHDDVWLNDHALLDKLRLALRRFDVVGVAGNKRRKAGQPAWLFVERNEKGFVADSPQFLSGAVAHGKPGLSQVTAYGPAPAGCSLMDGVLLAVRSDVARASGLLFDQRFTFDFYDMDFCRSAKNKGLSLGTWPLDIIHESGGEFGKASWEESWGKYQDKWGN